MDDNAEDFNRCLLPVSHYPSRFAFYENDLGRYGLGGIGQIVHYGAAQGGSHCAYWGMFAELATVKETRL